MDSDSIVITLDSDVVDGEDRIDLELSPEEECYGMEQSAEQLPTLSEEPLTAWSDEVNDSEPGVSTQMPPMTPPGPPPVTPPPSYDMRLSLLESRLRDFDDIVTRYGILLDQAVGRLDDMINHIGNQQRKDGRSIFEMRGVIHALVGEVGSDLIDARLQQQQQLQQQQLHQQQQFGHNFPNRGQRNQGQQANHQQNHQHQAWGTPAGEPRQGAPGREEPWKRQGRGGRQRSHQRS